MAKVVYDNYIIDFAAVSTPAGCRSSDAVCRWSGVVAADPPDEW